jgi:hypothetical protein
VKNEEDKKKNDSAIGEMHKRREKMADGKRYIIYYTFGKDSEESSKTIKKGEKDV